MFNEKKKRRNRELFDRIQAVGDEEDKHTGINVIFPYTDISRRPVRMTAPFDFLDIGVEYNCDGLRCVRPGGWISKKRANLL